eukprot:3833022-Lingulodinium_polyedra.AAC.1
MEPSSKRTERAKRGLYGCKTLTHEKTSRAPHGQKLTGPWKQRQWYGPSCHGELTAEYDKRENTGAVCEAVDAANAAVRTAA